MDGEGGSPTKMFVASLAIHIVLLGVFPILLASLRKEEKPEQIEVVFYRAEARPTMTTPAREPKPETLVTTQPEPAKVEPPPRPKSPSPGPRPEPKRETAPKVPKVATVGPRPEPALPQPPKPTAMPRPVRTGTFAETRTETVESATPRRETRSAGFGDTVAEDRAPPTRRNLGAGTRLGGFDVDSTPADDRPPQKHERVVSSANFGDGVAAEGPATKTPRNRGSVRSTGFSVGVTEESAPAGPPGAGSVSTGGFGETVAINETPRAPRKPPEEDPDTPVEILSKPKPVYTSEARELEIEGEVVLRVVFVASGEMRVLGVVEGLGHGLDEAAVDAAKQIEFKPARRNGEPVDYKAVLRIVFQLA